MATDLILGTAGHIDHGKTSLVRALTGTDTDRLPEEKSRGITIDLGFALLDLGDVRFGVVDVPGHERFIRNMLAGATGIDVALLVVAADDSIMPQTREHVEILDYLGVRHGVVALTKCDIVDEETCRLVEAEIRELLGNTLLKQAPIVRTVALLGQGIEALRGALHQAGKAAAPPLDQTAPFRMPIDRAFVLQGHGTVVTGSVLSGSVRLHDELEWHAGHSTLERVRVRALSNHGQSVPSLHRGQRGAINISGVPLERVHRGQELASNGVMQPARVMTIRLTASQQTHHQLRHRLPVRVHLGTAEVMARLSLLTANELEPGQVGFAQLFLEQHATAMWGQPLVLRDSAAITTLGGGVVLQPQASKIRRKDAAAQTMLEELATAEPARRVAAAAWFAGFAGLQPEALPRLAGLSTTQAQKSIEALQDQGILQQVPPLLHRDRLEELCSLVMKRLDALHAEQPLATRHSKARLVAHFDFLGQRELIERVIDRLMASGQMVADGDGVARADRKPKLSANQMKIKEKIVATLLAAGLAPPPPQEFARLAGGNVRSVQELLAIAVAEGEIVRVSPEVYLHRTIAAALQNQVRKALSERPEGMTVSEIKTLLGTTRKYAVPICEYLDQAGVTRRAGEVRQLIG